MIHRLFLAAAVFSGAFLLFQVQPLTGKLLLPWFGGSASVWSVCLIFFQTALWLGYVYAHSLTTTLRPARQAIVHSLILAASLALPTLTWSRSAAPAGDYLAVLTVLTTAVGLPYFLLAAGGPLLQSWYAVSRAGTPYRLFALSNLASLAGLLAYPFLIEPFLTLQSQTRLWSSAYAAAVAITVAAALPIALRAPFRPAVPSPAPALPAVPLADRALWFLLPACASSLLVSITTSLTQNVAPIPLVWIVPLTLYLATFIICFDRDGWYDPERFRMLLAGALLAITAGLLRSTSVADHRLVVAWFSGAFFLCCMFCHGELARRKPRPELLTSFYLALSFGGACGGVFASLIAPQLFPDYHELPLALLATALLAVFLYRREGNAFWRFWAGFTALLAILLAGGAWQASRGALLTARNFYGVLRVLDDRPAQTRTLMHGTVSHGVQLLDPARRREPTTYYGRRSGIGLALLHGCPPAACRVGVIGLGVGTLAAYARPADTFRFYEINPQVIAIARRDFQFLSDAAGRVDIVTGDARLSLDAEPPQQFDVLVVDAFSGDSVPVHLLTREAAALYLRHLKPGGVLALHVSNNFLNLPPLVQRLFEPAGRPIRLLRNPPDPQTGVLFSEWVLITANGRLFEQPEVAAVATTIATDPKLTAWTDDYSNLLPLLR